MTSMCPMCGWGISDRTFYGEGWMIDPTGRAAFKGPVFTLSRHKAVILHAIAEAGGQIVSAEALVNLTGSASESNNNIHSKVSQLRALLRKRGLPDPILGKYDGVVGGYRWDTPVSHEVIDND